MSWKSVHDFESLVSSWFGAKYGIAVDSCTHGIELCLRLKDVKELSIPKRTYLSIPSLSHKLGIPLKWRDEDWKDYYEIGNSGIYDAAVLWRENSYIPNSLMCLGYHYYMTPETAELGIKKFIDVVNQKPKQWVIEDWPDLSRMEIFR